MRKKKQIQDTVMIVFLSILALLYVYPIVMILFNSVKRETAITTSGAFTLPTADTFAGLANYANAIASKGFLQSLGYSLLITITSVAAILICCSMCAWYITRVKGKLSKILYYLFVFSMVVPFQMVMFTLSQTADSLSLNKPWNIWIIYLGFGAGLAVFMFRLYEIHSPGGGGSVHDRRLQSAADLLPDCTSHAEADPGIRRNLGSHVGMERLPSADPGTGY